MEPLESAGRHAERKSGSRAGSPPGPLPGPQSLPPPPSPWSCRGKRTTKTPHGFLDRSAIIPQPGLDAFRVRDSPTQIADGTVLAAGREGPGRAAPIIRSTEWHTVHHIPPPLPQTAPFLPLQWLHSSSAGQLVEVVAAKFASSAISSSRLYAHRPHDIPNFNCGT